MTTPPKTLDALIKAVSPMQKKCIEYIALGMEQKKAGLKAGYSPKSVDMVVSVMIRKPKAQAYLRYLQRKSTGETLLTRARKRELLQTCAESAEWTDSLKAIAEDNKMTGENAPQEINITGNLDAILERVRKHRE